MEFAIDKVSPQLWTPRRAIEGTQARLLQGVRDALPRRSCLLPERSSRNAEVKAISESPVVRSWPWINLAISVYKTHTHNHHNHT